MEASRFTFTTEGRGIGVPTRSTNNNAINNYNNLTNIQNILRGRRTDGSRTNIQFQEEENTTPAGYLGLVLGLLIFVFIFNFDSFLESSNSSSSSHSSSPVSNNDNSYNYFSSSPSDYMSSVNIHKVDKLAQYGLEFNGNFAIMKNNFFNNDISFKKNKDAGEEIEETEEEKRKKEMLKINDQRHNLYDKENTRLHITIVTRRTLMKTVRTAHMNFVLTDKFGEKHKLVFQGLDFRDLKKFVVQGFLKKNDFSFFADEIIGVENNANYTNENSKEDETKKCFFTGNVYINFEAARGKSVREIDEWTFSTFENDNQKRLLSYANSSSNNYKSYLRDLKGKSFESMNNEKNQNYSENDVNDEDTSNFIEKSSNALFDSVSSSSLLLSDPTSPVDIEGVIISADCNLCFYIFGWEVNMNEIISHIMHLSFIFNLKSLIEMRLFYNQMKHTELASAATKVSIVCITMHSMIDVFEGITMFYIGFLSRYMLFYFAIVAFLKLVLFCMMEVRYLMIVWKMRYQGDAHQRSELNRLSRNFYGCLLLIILSAYYVFPSFPHFIFFLYFFWVPQILWDIWKGQRNSLHPHFIVGMSICRLIFPLYIFGCPRNAFTNSILSNVYIKQNFFLCIATCSVVLIQVIILFVQRIFGSRSFVPLQCLPHVYNYYRTSKVSSSVYDEESGLPECVICMNEISSKDQTRVITPCDHSFHAKCLQQWMEVKMDCPTCRRELPPFS